MNAQLFIILLKRGLGFWDTFLQPLWWRRIPHLLHHLCTSANDCAGSALQQSQNKLSWVCATSAQVFLLLVCPCWRAWPPPGSSALWSTPWSVAVGAVSRALTALPCRTPRHLQGLCDNPFRNQERWHKTGTSGWFSRMDQLQIPLLVNLASKPFQQMFVLRHWMLSGCFFPLPLRSKCQHNGNSHKLTDQH